MSGIKYEVLAGDDLISALRGGRTGDLLDDAAYAAKAKRISELTQDLSELLPELVPVLKPKLKAHVLANAGMQAFHPPCTLQHGQKLKGGVETHLAELGFAIQVANTESHLCCGSADRKSVV